MLRIKPAIANTCVSKPSPGGQESTKYSAPLGWPETVVALLCLCTYHNSYPFPYSRLILRLIPPTRERHHTTGMEVMPPMRVLVSSEAAGARSTTSWHANACTATTSRPPLRTRAMKHWEQGQWVSYLQELGAGQAGVTTLLYPQASCVAGRSTVRRKPMLTHLL